MCALKEASTETAIEEVSRYGLTPLQARVFVGLIASGPSTGRRISELVGVNRVNVYRVLRQLQGRGLVNVDSERPNNYIPLKPDLAISLLVSNLEDHLKVLKEREKHVASLLSVISSSVWTTNEGDELDYVRLISVGAQKYRLLKEMIGRARHNIKRVAPPPYLHFTYMCGVPDVERMSSKRGVDIRTVTTISRNNLEEVSDYSRIVNLRHNPSLSTRLRFLIIDDREAVIGTTSEHLPMSEAKVIRTTYPGLISGLSVEFEELWEQSVNAQNVIETMSRHPLRRRE